MSGIFFFASFHILGVMRLIASDSPGNCLSNNARNCRSSHAYTRSVGLVHHRSTDFKQNNMLVEVSVTLSLYFYSESVMFTGISSVTKEYLKVYSGKLLLFPQRLLHLHPHCRPLKLFRESVVRVPLSGRTSRLLITYSKIRGSPTKETDWINSSELKYGNASICCMY